MSVLTVRGGHRLSGTVKVQGSKNSALPIMAASLMAEGLTVMHNCPRLGDIDAAMRILRYLGCKAWREADTVYIDSENVTRSDIPDSLMREMRSSVIFMGPLLARTGRAELSVPGGCELGPRPIDMHLASAKELGAKISLSGGSIFVSAPKLYGSEIHLRFPSVGATENTMLSAVEADGETVIINAAREPEIVDLQNYLLSLGADVAGAGTPIIKIRGRKIHGPSEIRVSSDRIACATYLAAAAITGGDISVTDAEPDSMGAILETFTDMGCIIKTEKNSISLSVDKLTAPPPIITRPYPGFPTDAQPPLMAACLAAEGTSVFVENIFESRYQHALEMIRMGADIKTEGRVAMVCGGKKLCGAPVMAHDLRGGAALVVAALAAEGKSIISGMKHVERGYEDIEDVLKKLGADIEKKY